MEEDNNRDSATILIIVIIFMENPSIKTKLEELKTNLLEKAQHPDTSDATANPGHILKGKTAYSNTGKITGEIETWTENDIETSESTFENHLVFEELPDDHEPISFVNHKITSLRTGCFVGAQYFNNMLYPKINKIYCKNVESVGTQAIELPYLNHIDLPNCKIIKEVSIVFGSLVDTEFFINLPNLETVLDSGINLENHVLYINDNNPFPKLKYTGGGAFERTILSSSFYSGIFFGSPNENSFNNMTFPELEVAGGGLFHSCFIDEIHLPKIKTINSGCFMDCYRLRAVYIESDSVPTLTIPNSTFSGTPIADANDADARIYVPESLVDEYKSSTNWSVFADKITAIEKR